MAILTAAQIITQARILALDNKSANPGLADSDYLALLNEEYLAWHEGREPRITWGNASTEFGTGIGGITANVFSLTTSRQNIAEVLEVVKTASASVTAGSLLEKAGELTDIISDVAATPTGGSPTRWFPMRVQSGTSTEIGKWSIFFHPPSDGTAQFLTIITKSYATVLASGDTPDVTEVEAYDLARIIALRAARLLGRDNDFISDLAQPLSDRVRQSAAIASKVMEPRLRPNENPA